MCKSSHGQAINNCIFMGLRRYVWVWESFGNLNNQIPGGSDIFLRMLNWPPMMTEVACLNEPLSEEGIGPRTAGQW